MRHRLFLVLALAGPLAAVAVATTQGARRPGCSIRGASVIVQTESARVLATKSRRSGEPELRKVYACSFRRGKLIYLGTDRAFRDEGPPPAQQQRILALALDEHGGSVVGYSVYRCPANTTSDSACTADVRVRNLNSGNQAAYAKAGARVWTIVVNSPAYAAFISERSDEVVEVHRLVREDDRVLDTGTGTEIDVVSLAAPEGIRNVSGGDTGAGNHFFWLTTAGPRTASVKCGFPGEQPCPAP